MQLCKTVEDKKMKISGREYLINIAYDPMFHQDPLRG